jgi:hypothetical protein
MIGVVVPHDWLADLAATIATCRTNSDVVVP